MSIKRRGQKVIVWRIFEPMCCAILPQVMSEACQSIGVEAFPYLTVQSRASMRFKIA